MSFSRFIVLCCLVLALAVILAGCKTTPAEPTQPVGTGPGAAQVRVIHASPGTPAVDVYAGNTRIVTNLAYTGSTEYAVVPPGTYQVRVFAAGTTVNPVIDASVDVAAGTSYTILAIGTLENIRPLVLVDDRTAPTAGEARVRFVHASPNAPAVDIRVPAVDMVLFENVAFGNATGYRNIGAGTYTVAVTPAGQPETAVLTVPNVTVEAGKTHTVVAVGTVAGEPPLASVVYEDR